MVPAPAPLQSVLLHASLISYVHACILYICVLQNFAVPETVEGDSEEAIQRMGLLEDMRVEWQQRKILEHYVHHAPPELFGVETVEI